MQRFNATEEYRKGYERGIKDKYSAESFMDFSTHQVKMKGNVNAVTKTA